MMKIKQTLTLVSLLGFLNHGSVMAAEQSFAISDWDELAVSGAYTIDIKENADQRRVLVNGASEDIQELTVETVRGKLVIKPKSHLSRIKDQLQITVFSPASSIKEIELSGASTVTFLWDKIASKEMEIDLSGASRLKIPQLISREIDLDQSGATKTEIRQIQAGKLELESSGSNESLLAGTVETLKIEASGAANLNLTDLSSKAAKLELSGASNLKLGPTESIEGKASGASRVSYQGQPKMNLSSSGAATIKAN
ncbi:MAG: GIN domain-containing protein [Oligoflexus sp.]